jgi:hypothetical protein
MELLMDEDRQHERQPRHKGLGLNFFRGERHEANIESSQVPPTGTTVTVMYKYMMLRSSQETKEISEE